MRLKVVELEEGAQKSARRKAKAAQEVRAEDDPLALLRRRRNLRLRRQADQHKVGVGQAPSLPEELNVVLMNVGTVPRAQQRHGSKMMWRCGGSETGGCGGSKRKKRGREGAERERVCEPLPLPLLPLLIASCGEAEEARRGGNVGLTAPTPPRPVIIAP